MTTIRKTIGKLFEDGGLQERGLRLMADGGYSDQGRYYDRSSKIVAGGTNILWGEQATGWEAYISGKPSQRARNQQVLAIAAGRLGMEVGRAYANGGVYGRMPAGETVTRSQVVVKSALPERLTLTVDGHQFTAYVRGQAAEVAQQQHTRSGAVTTQHERMAWS